MSSENPVPIQGDLSRDLDNLADYANGLDDRLDTLEDSILDVSETENGDFLQSDGSQLVPKSVSEMKTILGRPDFYEYHGGILFKNTNNPSPVAPLINTFPDNFALGTWTRTGVGVYTNTPSGSHSINGSNFLIGESFPVMDSSYNFVAMGYITFSAGDITLYTLSPSGSFVDVSSGSETSRFRFYEKIA